MEQAGRNAERQQVAVGNAVVADKSIVCVDGRKIEILRARVVIGQQALLAVRRIDIKSARLQGLAETRAEIAGITLEHQPTVQTEGRHHHTGRGRSVR